ncbi:hypothetical protein PP182_00375 [Maribacter sp. PR1]|uniref:DUF3575 domain-containing protein n=1 Tax=Maribacter cobaltidurans TaxID=1178778 RepID=A0ABU7INP0_9FLAO|nr:MULTISPECIES: hypothetical protein [Maribacter]MDC6387118.1 hypothetical protein [Maribacter sp. PR1]MEE1974504.1 hypothetical protein [Maribacter cobaltidurans]
MKKIFFLLIVFVGLDAQAQINGVTEKGFGIVNLERHQFKFDLLSPGISYELGLFKNVSASGGLGFGYATYEEGYAVGLTLHTRVRYYHNFNRRKRMNKNVSGNSGNYIAAARSIFFSQVRLATNIDGPDDFNLGVYGVTYGIQRTYENGFNFNAELGAGYYRGDGVPSGYGPLINFTFGWVATNRKSRKPTFD